MTPITVRYTVIPREHTVELREELLDPEALTPGTVLIETLTSMISAGTELANFTGEDAGVHTPGAYNAYPWRPGYGNIGRVLAVKGDEVGVAAGDTVFSFGKHASHLALRPAANPIFEGVFPIRSSLPPEELAVLRMALIAYTAPQLAPALPGDTVAVFGLGLVGNLAAQLYRLAGARVVGLDPMPERCALAERCGIEALNVAPADQLAALQQWSGGRGAAVTVDAAGHSGSVASALRACADYGHVVLLGSPRTPYTTDVTDLFRQIHLRWLTVHGALEWRLPAQAGPGGGPSIAGNLTRLVGFAEQGQLLIQPLISQIVRPDQIGEAYAGLLGDKQAYWGVVLDWR